MARMIPIRLIYSATLFLIYFPSVPFGATYQLTWGDYRGDRIGLFNFNTKGDHGFVDVDWYRYTYTK